MPVQSLKEQQYSSHPSLVPLNWRTVFILKLTWRFHHIQMWKVICILINLFIYSFKSFFGLVAVRRIQLHVIWQPCVAKWQLKSLISESRLYQLIHSLVCQHEVKQLTMNGSAVQFSGVRVRRQVQVEQGEPICPTGGNVSQLPILIGWMRAGNRNNHHSTRPILGRLQEAHTRPTEPLNRTEAPTGH